LLGSVARVSVAIVADSTGYIPEGAVPGSLTVVPLTVVVDGRSFAEGVQITPRDVAAALHRRSSVSTSRVSPGQFQATYQHLAAAGVSEIVSIHLSGDLSGTYDAAVLAGRECDIPVTVIDSRTVGLALGFCVRQAALMAADGAPASQIVSEVRRRCGLSRTWLVVDSLEQLRRGGRLGSGQALLGSALMIKPILEVRDGHVEPIEKHRTMRKAVDRMAELALAALGGTACDVAVQHVDAAERAGELAARMSRALSDGAVSVVEVGAVIAAHVGLGTVSIAAVPR
jgi:DegV family protein with EDD domain